MLTGSRQASLLKNLLKNRRPLNTEAQRHRENQEKASLYFCDSIVVLSLSPGVIAAAIRKEYDCLFTKTKSPAQLAT
ncbi:hypothetical protein [Undibacterium umbellatum]|jgi:hypothetical protein|uniref:Uncharacterized protein n=1 Tax=Undibacterium umbellatum TaxID=2762300 RepID=A0ABR6Z6T8_9BURK|nr:hypothetical protein [Undibacterium umbellatum]MBC3907492.1 hypothetical protein [Undibacterium umbellatum]